MYKQKVNLIGKLAQKENSITKIIHPNAKCNSLPHNENSGNTFAIKNTDKKDARNINNNTPIVDDLNKWPERFEDFTKQAQNEIRARHKAHRVRFQMDETNCDNESNNTCNRSIGNSTFLKTADRNSIVNGSNSIIDAATTGTLENEDLEQSERYLTWNRPKIMQKMHNSFIDDATATTLENKNTPIIDLTESDDYVDFNEAKILRKRRKSIIVATTTSTLEDKDSTIIDLTQSDDFVDWKKPTIVPTMSTKANKNQTNPLVNPTSSISATKLTNATQLTNDTSTNRNSRLEKQIIDNKQSELYKECGNLLAQETHTSDDELHSKKPKKSTLIQDFKRLHIDDESSNITVEKLMNMSFFTDQYNKENVSHVSRNKTIIPISDIDNISIKKRSRNMVLKDINTDQNNLTGNVQNKHFEKPKAMNISTAHQLSVNESEANNIYKEGTLENQSSTIAGISNLPNGELERDAMNLPIQKNTVEDSKYSNNGATDSNSHIAAGAQAMNTVTATTAKTNYIMIRTHKKPRNKESIHKSYDSKSTNTNNKNNKDSMQIIPSIKKKRGRKPKYTYDNHDAEEDDINQMVQIIEDIHEDLPTFWNANISSTIFVDEMEFIDQLQFYDYIQNEKLKHHFLFE